MATRQQSLTPLIDIQSAAFAEQHERGINWSMYGDKQGEGPVPASYLLTNLQQYAERGYFEQHGPSHLHYLGFLHRDGSLERR